MSPVLLKDVATFMKAVGWNWLYVLGTSIVGLIWSVGQQQTVGALLSPRFWSLPLFGFVIACFMTWRGEHHRVVALDGLNLTLAWSVVSQEVRLSVWNRGEDDFFSAEANWAAMASRVGFADPYPVLLKWLDPQDVDGYCYIPSGATKQLRLITVTIATNPSRHRDEPIAFQYVAVSDDKARVLFDPHWIGDAVQPVFIAVQFRAKNRPSERRRENIMLNMQCGTQFSLDVSRALDR